jgi:hypothetical protein
MSTVLVTVRGPAGEEDVVAPADAPIERVLGAMLEETDLARDGGGDWELGAPGRPPYAARRSLEEQGVLDGAVIELRPAGTSLARETEPVLPALDPGGPLARTRAILPRRPTLPDRLRGAFGALRRGGMRASWRETDYRRILDARLGALDLAETKTIALVSATHGSGTSTIALLVGSLLSGLRPDRVVLADLSAPDRENRDPWSDRAPGTPDHELSRSIDGLQICRPARSAGIEELIGELRSRCELLLLDCGTVGSPAAEGAVECADEIVLVCDAESDANASPSGGAARALAGETPFVVVLNKRLRIGSRTEPSSFERSVPAARGLLAVGSDRVLASRLAAGRLSWIQRPPAGSWPLAIRELAFVALSALE